MRYICFTRGVTWTTHAVLLRLIHSLIHSLASIVVVRVILVYYFLISKYTLMLHLIKKCRFKFFLIFPCHTFWNTYLNVCFIINNIGIKKYSKLTFLHLNSLLHTIYYLHQLIYCNISRERRTEHIYFLSRSFTRPLHYLRWSVWSCRFELVSSKFSWSSARGVSRTGSDANTPSLAATYRPSSAKFYIYKYTFFILISLEKNLFQSYATALLNVV